MGPRRFSFAVGSSGPDPFPDRKAKTMHAILVKVTIADREAAEKGLKENLVPAVSGAPGFVAGYWMHLASGKGTSVMFFDSEHAAQAFAGQFQPPPDAPVTMDSVEVGEVLASA